MSLPNFPSEIPFDCLMQVVNDVRAKESPLKIAQGVSWAVGCCSAYVQGNASPLVGATAEAETPQFVTIEEAAEAIATHLAVVQESAGDELPSAQVGGPAQIPAWLMPTLLQILQLVLPKILGA